MLHTMSTILNFLRWLSNFQRISDLKFNQFYGLNFPGISDNTRIIVNVPVPDSQECSVIYKFDGILFYKNLNNANPLSEKMKERLPKGTYIDLNTLKCPIHDVVNEYFLQRVVFKIKQITRLIRKAFLKENCVFCLALSWKNVTIPSEYLETSDTVSLTLDDHLNEAAFKSAHLNLREMRAIVTAFRRAQTKLNFANLDKIKKRIQKEHNLSVAIALAIHHMEKYRTNLATNEEEEFRVRDVQILAVILAAIERGNSFHEVQTGEGKTIIIALIAAVKLLLNDVDCVDIITCNEALAKHNHNDMKPFFASLHISLTCNNPVISDEVYKQQVVYGALHNFQYDELQKSPNSDECGRRGRKFAFCIIDEVDLLTIDNSKHMAKIAAPFPGIEELKTVYEQIFHEEELAKREINKEINLKMVPKYLRNLCEHMMAEWKEVCKQMKENRYMKDHNYTLVKEDRKLAEDAHDPADHMATSTDNIAPIDVHSGVVMHRTTFNDGMQQFLEMYHACPVSPQIFNSISISNYGYLKKYEQQCGFTGTLGEKTEESLLMKMFGKIKFYRIPRHSKSEFVRHPTVVVQEGEFQIIHKALKLGNQVKIYADNNYYRMNKLLGLFNQYPKRAQDRIQILALDNYIPPSDCSNTIVEIVDNYTGPTNKKHVIFNRFKYWHFILDAFQRKSCIHYYDSKINWKLNIIDHLLEQIYPETNSESFRDHLNTLIGDEQYEQITIFDKTNENFVVDPQPNPAKKITINKNMVASSPQYAMIKEVFVFPFLRGPKFTINDNKLEALNELTVLNDIVMLEAPERTVMFVFGKYRKHFQIIDAHIKEILDERRAVLVVFENLKMLNHYKRVAKDSIKAFSKKMKASMKEYHGRDVGYIASGDVILTTNIGGRGADFRITDELHQNGGLHVIITFMPPNERVERQAFGRAARNGSPGSGRIIVDAYNLSTSFASSVINEEDTVITQQRNAQYKRELRQMSKEVVVSLQKQDVLTTAFCELHHRLRESHSSTAAEYDFVLDDLTEYWAVWLKMNLKTNADFKRFESDAHDLIEKRTFYNPCHWIRRAKYHLCYNNTDEAKRLLEATFDQEIFSEAIVKEYVHFTQLAIAKGKMLNEALEALLKEPCLLYHKTQELIDMLLTTAVHQNHYSSDQLTHKNVLRYIEHQTSSSKWISAIALILIPAGIWSCINLKFTRGLNYFSSAYSVLRSTQWDENTNQNVKDAAKDLYKDVSQRITNYFSANSEELRTGIEEVLTNYGDDYISRLTACQKYINQIQSIIAEEVTTKVRIAPDRLEKIIKDELKNFRFKASMDDTLDRFKNHCRRINSRIDELEYLTDAIVIDPQIVMGFFGDCLQHQMKESFCLQLFEKQCQRHRQHLHNRQRNL